MNNSNFYENVSEQINKLLVEFQIFNYISVIHEINDMTVPPEKALLIRKHIDSVLTQLDIRYRQIVNPTINNKSKTYNYGHWRPINEYEDSMTIVLVKIKGFDTPIPAMRYNNHEGNKLSYIWSDINGNVIDTPPYEFIEFKDICDVEKETEDET